MPTERAIATSRAELRIVSASIICIQFIPHPSSLAPHLSSGSGARPPPCAAARSASRHSRGGAPRVPVGGSLRRPWRSGQSSAPGSEYPVPFFPFTGRRETSCGERLHPSLEIQVQSREGNDLIVMVLRFDPERFDLLF